MKPSSLFALPLFSAVLLLLVSCGGNTEKTATSTTSKDTTVSTTATQTVPMSTIVSTPQDMLVIKQKVSNFSKWKPIYEGHDTARTASGLHNYVIGRGVDDSNMVIVALKADDMTKAKSFAKDPGLKAAMQKGGVVGTPSFRYITMVFQDTASISSTMRSLTTFTVKDWDTWRKAFESHKQTRLDNGLTDRAFGYDADDKHKVFLVVALLDSAKAKAFWKSDLLKQQRTESGVVSQPERFVYQVVQKY
ncbi:MAG: hypothetical protein ACXVMS_05845 [Flavisolibacter sp.]